MKLAFLVKNLYGYEKVVAPPLNLPSGMKTVYVTDVEKTARDATSLGWDIVKVTHQFNDRNDMFSKRKAIAFINCYPHLIVPEISDYDKIFVCDSNITSLWNKYKEFIRQCPSDKALYVTSGYYSGNRDNIVEECAHSTKIGHRWSYNRNDIIESTNRYVNDIKNKEISVKDLSIVSAKYIGWNLKHPNFNLASKILFDEYNIHLQGNIILTWMSGVYSNLIFNYSNNDYSGTKLNKHNFLA